MKQGFKGNKKPGNDMRKNIAGKIFIVILVIVAISLSGCKEQDLQEIILHIRNAYWYTEVDGFGYVYLSLHGCTNAIRVTVFVFGDGVPAEMELVLNRDNCFRGDICIRFTHAPDDRPFVQNTKVRAYRGTEYAEVLLESEELRFFD